MGNGERSMSITLEEVRLNHNLARLLNQVFLDLVESLKVDAQPLRAEPTLLRRITWQELQSHKHAEDLWVAIEGKVYDLTQFAKRHPGGSYILAHVAGTDATVTWQQQHGSSQHVRSIMAAFCMGKLVDVQ